MTNYTMRVLVNGKAATQYNHDGDVYLEGRAGSAYELELRNNTSEDAEFVVSIDGLSIVDGKPAGAASTGYIISAWQTARIKGWKFDADIAAAFKFGSKAKSYAALSDDGDVQNTGVMGLQVFPRKKVYRTPTVTMQPYWYTDHLIFGDDGGRGITRGLAPRGEVASGAVSKGINLSASSLNQIQATYTGNIGMAAAGSPAAEFNTSLGTEFGDAVNFKTTKVEFERASNKPAHTFITYYGDAKDLNKLGIVLDWQKPSVKPQAFPADGCKAPAGWTVKR